ncbi:MAG: hypothetical protein RIQ81_126 [Pseudomonadota bacterium]
MRLTKIYTKVGDKGLTYLANGSKVPKYHLRIDAYGTIDELNAFAGMLRDQLHIMDQQKHLPKIAELTTRLRRIQNELFDVGGELATPIDALDISRQQVVSHESVSRLEQEIDEFNNQLEPLANFVLPGGHPANSLAHVVRTVCRRAERAVVALAGEDTIREEVSIYLNRLSDWFFVASRVISQEAGVPELLWQQKGKNTPPV